MTYLVKMLQEQSQRYPTREVYRFRWRKGGEWKQTTWQEFKMQVDTCARALASFSIESRQESSDLMPAIAICSPNSPQVFISELAAFCNRYSSTPIYPTSSQQQVDFILTDCRAAILFVGDKHQYPLAYNFWKKHPERIAAIVHFDNYANKFHPDDTVSMTWNDFMLRGEDMTLQQVVDERTQAGTPEDLATLMYTSGTTGEPKGVMLCHEQYEAAMRMHLQRLSYVQDTDLSLSFLPMSHILEKAWCFFCLTRGIRIAVNYDPRTIQDTIQEVNPNIMCSVPRFWEKVYTATRKRIDAMPPFQRMMVRRALKVGRKYNLKYRRIDAKAPRLLRAEYRFWDKQVFSHLKHAIGIPDPNFFPTAGAPISDRICSFFRSVGIDIVVGYGLSETTATVSCFPEYGYEIGSVGTPLPQLQVRIADDGEILVKGKSVMKGYHNNPEANRAAFTDDGFFRTGDAGYFTEQGALVLTERIKDLFKTSNGKYVAPQALEKLLAEDAMVSEIAIIGNNRPYVTALVVPDYAQLEAWADKKGVKYSNIEELTSNPIVTEMMLDRIRPLQKRMAPHEQIKKIVLLPKPFSLQEGELTNTLKVRRSIVEKRYAPHIEKMYQK